MKSLVLLPTYNERENVKTVIPEILSALPDADVLVVDDGSPDGTAGVVEEMMRFEPRIHLLRRRKKDGLGEAYKHAYREALRDSRYEAFITMDADGSHDPRCLPVLLSTLADADLVVGSRYVAGGGIENWEAWRYVLSKYGNLYSRILTGVGINDLTAGFVAVRRSLMERVDFDDLGASGYAYQIEFKFHAVRELGAKAVEVPIIFKRRREGESKISRHIVREGLKTPIRLFLRRFLR
jgi:dolichol-phosphate mannosyltransferase